MRPRIVNAMRVTNAMRAIALGWATAALLLAGGCAMQTGTAEEASASKTDQLTVATPTDPAAPSTAPQTGQENKATPQPADPGAPAMSSGGPNEPDPSPWKGDNAALGPNEPDPSPWRGTLETATKSR
jgi:hypothetical protein